MNNTFTASLLALALVLESTYAGALPSRKVASAVYRFEKVHSSSAVIILKAATAEIAFVYNPEFALRRRFPPGSLAKVWSAAVMLENSDKLNFNPAGYVKCTGRFYIPRKITLTKRDRRLFNIQTDGKDGRIYFKCSLVRGHHSVKLSSAIVHSCNVYFLTHSCGNPEHLFQKLIDIWHLNSNTGARMKYQELPGRSNVSPTRFMAASSAIGEGGSILVSPLKVAQTFSAIFERTPLLRPFQKPYRNPLKQYDLKLSTQTRELLLRSLSRTLSTGTLKKLKTGNPAIILIGGKTGTGTHFRKKFSTHGWVALYFRYKNISYTLVSFVYRGSGGREALQLTQKVLDAL